MMSGEFLLRKKATDDEELVPRTWSLRHPFFMLLLLGALCAAAMGVFALVA